MINGVVISPQLTKDPAFRASPTTSKRYSKRRDNHTLPVACQLHDRVLSGTRQCVEQLFGDCTNRFRILKGVIQIGGHYWHKRLQKLIRCCFILHNLCLTADAESCSDAENDRKEESDILSVEDEDYLNTIPASQIQEDKNTGLLNRAVITEYLSHIFELHGTSYRATDINLCPSG